MCIRDSAAPAGGPPPASPAGFGKSPVLVVAVSVPSSARGCRSPCSARCRAARTAPLPASAVPVDAPIPAPAVARAFSTCPRRSDTKRPYPTRRVCEASLITTTKTTIKTPGRTEEHELVGARSRGIPRRGLPRQAEQAIRFIVQLLRHLPPRGTKPSDMQIKYRKLREKCCGFGTVHTSAQVWRHIPYQRNSRPKSGDRHHTDGTQGVCNN